MSNIITVRKNTGQHQYSHNHRQHLTVAGGVSNKNNGEMDKLEFERKMVGVLQG